MKDKTLVFFLASLFAKFGRSVKTMHPVACPQPERTIAVTLSPRLSARLGKMSMIDDVCVHNVRELFCMLWCYCCRFL